MLVTSGLGETIRKTRQTVKDKLNLKRRSHKGKKGLKHNKNELYVKNNFFASQIRKVARAYLHLNPVLFNKLCNNNSDYIKWLSLYLNLFSRLKNTNPRKGPGWRAARATTTRSR